MVNRILVALDGWEDLPLVEQASALAQRHHAELVLVCGLPRPSLFTAFAPGAYAMLHADLRLECDRLAAQAVAGVPQDVSVRWSHVHCRARHAVAELACRPGDLVLGPQAVARPWRSISQRAFGRLPHRLSRA